MMLQEAAVWLRHEVGAHWPPAFVGFMTTGAAACWSVSMVRTTVVIPFALALA
jgi:hypothetical protein